MAQNEGGAEPSSKVLSTIPECVSEHSLGVGFIWMERQEKSGRHFEGGCGKWIW